MNKKAQRLLSRFFSNANISLSFFRRLLIFFFILPIFTIFSCGGGGDTTVITSGSNTGTIIVSYRVPIGVYKVIATILDTKNNPVSGFQKEKDVTPGESVTIIFNNIFIGTYNIKLEGLDSEGAEILYTGQTDSVAVTNGGVAEPSVIARYIKSDIASPGSSNHSPANGVTNIPANTQITVQVSDADAGVDISSIILTVNGTDVTSRCSILGISDNYTVIYTPSSNLSGTVTITLHASDLANPANSMATETWSFEISSGGATDITAPSNPAISFGGITETSSKIITVTISASDDTGITGYYLSESGTTPTGLSEGWVSIQTTTTSYNSDESFTLSSGNGDRTIYVWFKDGAGNISASASAKITLNQTDLTAPSSPTISINSGASSTTTASVTLSLSAKDDTGVTGYCAKETSTTPPGSDTCWASVTSTTSYSANISFTLSSGSGVKTVHVWFRDSAGNISASASNSITLSASSIITDTVPPDTSITSQPSNLSNSTSASFSFTSTETGSTFQCQMDSGGYSSCTSPKSYTGLTEGSHTFYVKATDSAGNTDSTPASYTWTIDTTAPTGTISINDGATYITSTSVTLTLSCSDSGSGCSQMQFSNDNSTWTTEETYTTSKSYTLLTGDGTKTVYVKFKDVIGNLSGAYSDTIALDATAPDTSIISQPSNPSYSTSASFSFTSTETGSTFQCQIDSGGYSSCTSPKSYTGLTEGSHTFYVKATDSAGNTDSTPASYTWTIDTTAPDTSITDYPTSPISQTSASFSFTSTETGSTFQCQIDSGGYSSCTSPKSYTGLTDGSHTFYVKATDSAGNTDSTPASYTWTVDTTAPSSPTVSINSGASSTASTSVTLTLSAIDAVGVTGYYASESSTQPSIGTAGWTSVTSTTSYSENVSFALSSGEGTKTVYVWFRDESANASSANDSITYSIWTKTTVDTAGDAGKYNSIVRGSNNKMHISYYGENKLKYTTNATGSWAIETVETTENLGPFTSMAMDSNNKLHISYFDYGLSGANQDLKYATNATGSWVNSSIYTTNNSGRMSSIALDSSGKAHIAFLEESGGTFSLKYITNSSGSWSAGATVDSGIGTLYGGGSNYFDETWFDTPSVDIAIDSAGKIHIVYYHDYNGTLKYATNSSGTWGTATLDTGSVGVFPSIAIDSNGKLHVSYYDFSSNDDLKYATNTTGTWVNSTVDTTGNVGKYTSIAIDSNNKAHISYYDVTNNDLKYATNASGSWVTSTVDTGYGAGTYTSIAIDSANKVHISYKIEGYDHDLKYATNQTLSLMSGSMQTGNSLSLSNTVTTIAGSTTGYSGSADGTGTAARFYIPTGITTDGTNLFVAEYGNHTIRKIVISTGVVTTIAGSAGSYGSTDGTGTAARFYGPNDITTDGTNLFVADYANYTIRKIVISTGVVTTIAGSAGSSGSTDGTGTAARFYNPGGITTDGINLFVADYNHTIRKIVISTGVVTTIAGSAGYSGSADGTGTSARFDNPTGITTDGTNLFVTDRDNHTIRKIVISTGVVTTIAGSAGSYGSTNGTGTAARFYLPHGITTDGTNLHVVDMDNHTIRKIVISTGVVTTIAGSAGYAGGTDGTGSAARFYYPHGITTDGINLFVVNRGYNNIRKIQ